ncbi:hypothetical protein D3C78_1669690 [compost metagenome]
MALSLAPNSCLIGSIITARIWRPTKLSAYISASRNSRPWLCHRPEEGVARAMAASLAEGGWLGMPSRRRASPLGGWLGQTGQAG